MKIENRITKMNELQIFVKCGVDIKKRWCKKFYLITDLNKNAILIKMSNNAEYQKISLIKEFKVQLVKFLDELCDQFPQEGDLMLIRFFISEIPMADVLGRYQRDILPFEEKITRQDDRFFLEHPFLYTKTPITGEKINHFKELWTKNILSNEDKETVWKWMNLFNRIAKCYLKQFGYVQGWERKEESLKKEEKSEITTSHTISYNQDTISNVPPPTVIVSSITCPTEVVCVSEKSQDNNEITSSSSTTIGTGGMNVCYLDETYLPKRDIHCKNGVCYLK